MPTKLMTANSTKAPVMPNSTFSPNRRPVLLIAAAPQPREDDRSRSLPDNSPHVGRRVEVQEADHSLIGYWNHVVPERRGRRRCQIGGDVEDIRIGEIVRHLAHHGVRIIGAAFIAP